MIVTLTYQTILKNTYSIQEVLGQGGFGITYKAMHVQLQKEMCVKELFISGSSTRGQNNTVVSQNIGEFTFDDFKQRFIQEAQQLAKFDHQNIVRVIDLFEENNTAYMVMEFEEGLTLKQYIQQNGVLSIETSFKIMHQLLNAVEEVHQNKMLHRDIKPDNIIIKPNDKVVLIDFGSARSFGEGKTITQTALLTPGYAPREQYSTRAKRGAFSDIYALGATFYFLLTGKKPIPSIDREEEVLAPPHQINSSISTQISSAIMLAMEIKPEDRFQSITEFRGALNDLAKNNNVDKTKVIVSKNSLLPYDIPESIQDIDGNEYPVVKIGEQLWLGENLRTTRFQNGDEIMVAKNKKDWAHAIENKLPACAWFKFDEDNYLLYGLYYNYFAVKDSRKICPKNWEMPNQQNLNNLLNYLNDKNEKIDVLISKYENISKFFSKDIVGTDKYNLKLRLGGYLDCNIFFTPSVHFLGWGSFSVYWMIEKSFRVDFFNGIILNNYHNQNYGYNIRCIKKQENE